jgi:Fur family ferric uptake transcriptional regulator
MPSRSQPKTAPVEPPAGMSPEESGFLENAALEVLEPLCAVFRRKIKSEGLKYTPERAQVLDSVVRQEGTFDVDLIITQVRKTGIRVSKATVYRTMKLLQEAGIIQRVLFDGEIAHYQLVYGQTNQQMLIDVERGSSKDVQIPQLIGLCRQVAKLHGYDLKSVRLQLFATRIDDTTAPSRA